MEFKSTRKRAAELGILRTTIAVLHEKETCKLQPGEWRPSFVHELSDAGGANRTLTCDELLQMFSAVHALEN